MNVNTRRAINFPQVSYTTVMLYYEMYYTAANQGKKVILKIRRVVSFRN
jgi:hypothetical protein